MLNAVYANARAKANENYLLGYDRLLRIIDCPTISDAFKVLSEVNFGGGITLSAPNEFEKLLTAERQSLTDFIKTNCPNEYLINYFLYPLDFHNAESLLRAKHLKIGAEDMLGAEGVFSIDYLKDKIFADEYRDFPKWLKNALIEGDAKFVSGNTSGAEINLIFKKALYQALLEECKKDKTLFEIFRAKIDFINISVALRLRNYQLAKESFLEGGLINISDLKMLCEENLDSLKQKCIFLEHKDFILSAINQKSQSTPLSDFEKEVDGFELSILKKNRYNTGGLYPFMLYCQYKLAEINNVRIILVGLQNGIEKDQIKRRLRNTYEG